MVPRPMWGMRAPCASTNCITISLNLHLERVGGGSGRMPRHCSAANPGSMSRVWPPNRCGEKSRKFLRWRKTGHCFDRQGVRGGSYIGIIQEKKKAVASTGFNAFVRANSYREDRMRGFLVVLSTLAMVTAGAAIARADDYVVTIKDHRFTPAEI